MKVSDFLLQTLEKNGITHIFGNPGTTEIPLVQACEKRKKLKYIVALSEVAAVPMADGYARATRSLGVVNLHVAPGLGNGMGNLYTARIAGTPLLVLIGGQDRRFLHTNPILWGPVERMASTVCKAVFSLNTQHDAAANIMRALRMVLTPPFAPVGLICPPDLLEQEIDSLPSKVTAPLLSSLSVQDAMRYGRFLTKAKKPALIATESVHWTNASAPLEALARKTGSLVYAAPYTGILPLSAKSPHYAGYLPPSFKQISDRLAQHDALLFIGGRGLRTTLYSEAALSQKMAWLGDDGSIQPPNGEFELARIVNVRKSIENIIQSIKHFRKKQPAFERTVIALPPTSKKYLHPSRAVHALLNRYKDAIWIDESGLSTSDVRQWIESESGDYIINGSGGIGWGLPASVGAAIGKRNRQIVAIVGDGSALYASEAMWTAGHHDAKLLLIVLSNRRYATLNEAASRLANGPLKAFTIEPPVLNFSGLAALYGFQYKSVATENELDAFLKNSRGQSALNTLLELKLPSQIKPVTASRHF